MYKKNFIIPLLDLIMSDIIIEYLLIFYSCSKSRKRS